jgi:hypothetical protein
MSSDFGTELVLDARLRDVSDKIQFAVRKGSAENTYQQFRANSQTPSHCSFTVNPPSESTVIDRRMLIRSRISFRITVNGGALAPAVFAPFNAFQYGLRESFQAFPLNRLFQTVTLSINNVSTSVNNNHVLSALLRMIDQEVLQEYDGMTPTYLDNYSHLVDAVGQANSPLNGYGQAGYDCHLLPRGVHPLEIQGFLIERRNAGGVLIDNSPVFAAVDENVTIDVSAIVTEPLFVSPMLFGDSKFNHSGYLGINNFQLVMNVDSTMSRMWSTGLDFAAGTYTLSNLNFQDTELLLNFLTAPVHQVLPAKSVLPYYSYTSYVTNGLANLAAKAQRVAAATDTKAISSIQLEVIPDKLLIFVRQSLSTQNAKASDTFLEIRSVSCTFANKSGLLSNATQQQLYELSRKNGSKIDWYGFTGLVNRQQAAAPWVDEYGTCGSLLVIDPSQDFGLSSPFLANGSIGQFNLQITLTYANNRPVVITPEIVVVAARAGMVTTSAGQSTLTTSILNADIVTRTIEGTSEPMSTAVNDRLIGGMGGMGDGPAYKKKYGGVRSGGEAPLSSRLSALAM